MNKIEIKLIEFIEIKKHCILFVVITLCAFGVRVCGMNFISKDMESYLLPWFQWYSNNGLQGLKIQVGDYNLMYQTIIALMSKTTINPVYVIKLFSTVFDFILASLFVLIVKEAFGVRDHFILLIAYAMILFMPTVIINSAYWGQIDAMYTVFVIMTVFLLYSRHYPLAFIAFGLSLGCKLQSVFILPFIMMVYLRRKDFSLLLHLFYSLITFWSLGIVAYMYGRSLLSPFYIYFLQASSYPQMFLNFPSFWVLFSNDYYSFGLIALLLTITIMLLGVLYFYSCRDFENRFFVYVSWVVWTAVLFLPKMHERYAFLLDILLLLICFYDKRFIKYVFVSIILSIITYGNYFCGIWKMEGWDLINDVNILYLRILMALASVAYTSAYCCFSYDIIVKGECK